VDHSFENGAFRVDIQARAAYPARQKNIEAVRPEVFEVEPGLMYEDEDVKSTLMWWTTFLAKLRTALVFVWRLKARLWRSVATQLRVSP